MKKGVSIALVILLLAAMFNFSVAVHFCGGKVAASKVSLTGKLASCGMEGSEKRLPLSGTTFTTFCCDDNVTYCGTSNNYTPPFTFLQDPYQNTLQFLSIQTGLPVYPTTLLKSLYADASPPWELMSTDVDLSDICIFRI
jgi:hypothetical protein